MPGAVVAELRQGRDIGHELPQLERLPWLAVVDPGSMPSEWLALELGPVETSAMALALEHPQRILLLDDSLARRTASAAGLRVWGVLRVLLEAKAAGLTDRVAPLVRRLEETGTWISEDVRTRVLRLAGEAGPP